LRVGSGCAGAGVDSDVGGSGGSVLGGCICGLGSAAQLFPIPYYNFLFPMKCLNEKSPFSKIALEKASSASSYFSKYLSCSPFKRQNILSFG